MWNEKYGNFICGYVEAYENQRKHIERVLSAKDIINSLESPYYPKFLKLKCCKHQMEEEKNDRINEGNRQLMKKIVNAEEKPSQYSKIFEPKKCPAFDKEAIYFKRIRKDIANYKDIVRFYNKISKVKSNYNHEKLIERTKFLDDNKNRLQKSVFKLNPSLFFLSPIKIKNEIQKFKNKYEYNGNGNVTSRSMKRSSSCFYSKVRPNTAGPKTTKNRCSSVCSCEKINNNINEPVKIIEKNNKNNKSVEVNNISNKKINNKENDKVNETKTLEIKKSSSINSSQNKSKNKLDEDTKNKKDSSSKKINEDQSEYKINKSGTKSNKLNRSSSSSLMRDSKKKMNQNSNKNDVNSSEKISNQSNIKPKKSKLKRNTSEVNIFHS